MENIAVIFIIVAAALYVASYFYKRVRNKGGGGCGCSNPSCKAAETSKGPKSSLPCCKE